MSSWPQRGLLETKMTTRSLPLAPSLERLDLRALMGKVSGLLYSSAELFYWEEEEGWEKPSHRTAVVSGDRDTLTVSHDVCLNLGERAQCF